MLYAGNLAGFMIFFTKFKAPHMGKFYVARLLPFLTFAQCQKVKDSGYTMFVFKFFGSVYPRSLTCCCFVRIGETLVRSHSEEFPLFIDVIALNYLIIVLFSFLV